MSGRPPAKGEWTMATKSANRARALAAPGWLALALATACAHATRTAARRDAELRRAVAAYERTSGGATDGASDSVNVGYGMQVRRTVLSPVGSKSIGRDETWTRGARLEELLEGRIPGLEVQRLPNGDFTVRVRGITSLGGGDEPLWVVDGVPISTSGSARQILRDIDSRDVVRIDVLKGSAASIYGSRGSNGVILVTLRRPR
jgi:TonB-dependent SusC/RagA subfamily outer membrane receptor